MHFAFSRYDSIGISQIFQVSFRKLHTSNINVHQGFMQTVDSMDLITIVHFGT